jgi:hypothetical protein
MGNAACCASNAYLLVAVGAGADLEAGVCCWAEAAKDRRLAKTVRLRTFVARPRTELERFMGLGCVVIREHESFLPSLDLTGYIGGAPGRATLRLAPHSSAMNTRRFSWSSGIGRPRARTVSQNSEKATVSHLRHQVPLLHDAVILVTVIGPQFFYQFLI